MSSKPARVGWALGTARAKTREAVEEACRVLGARWADPFPAGIWLWTPGSAFTSHNPWKALKEISAPTSATALSRHS